MIQKCITGINDHIWAIDSEVIVDDLYLILLP